MSLSSESSVSNTIPRYLYWSTEFTYCPPNFKTGVAVLLALLALIVIQAVLLQSKIIPCDSAYAWPGFFLRFRKEILRDRLEEFERPFWSLKTP